MINDLPVASSYSFFDSIAIACMALFPHTKTKNTDHIICIMLVCCRALFSHMINDANMMNVSDHTFFAQSQIGGKVPEFSAESLCPSQ